MTKIHEPLESLVDLDESDNDCGGNVAWVDSIVKILKTNKTKAKKNLTLSKAKKITDVKKQKTKPAGYQVATAAGEIKDEKIVIEEPVIQEPARKKKRELPNLRIKPNILEKDREKTLSKIATRGVVQLFNAVKMQQKDITKKLEDAGPLEVHKDKVLKSIDKREFLNVLMGEKSQIVDDTTSENKSKKETWNVLREDFMIRAKLKDWDKEVEKEVEEECEGEMESE